MFNNPGSVNMDVIRRSENVHDLRLGGSCQRADFEQWMLILSDIHFDNPKCDRKLFFKHLDEAREKNAPVFINGDLFCLMQGKYDPRKNKSDIRPEHNKSDYLDAVINDTADKLAPYGDILTVIGRGNHEQAILKHQETDVTRRFCLRLSEKCGRDIYPGGYGGWLRPTFGGREYGSGTVRQVNIKYFHGSGGGGPVTKGVIKTNRMAVYLPDAHIVTTGHVHEKWAVTLSRERITKAGAIRLDNQLHICTGTYKEEYGQGLKGWHVERGAPPKPLGGYWVRFTSELVESRNYRINYSAMEAA